MELSLDLPLGALWSREKTLFRVFAPTASCVFLNLYSSSCEAEPFLSREMLRDGELWSLEISGDLNGVYYTYSVNIENEITETIDIYARSAGADGARGLVFDGGKTAPAGFENSSFIALQSPADAVIYELHVRDFSSDENASFVHRGKFLAFCERGVKNSFGDAAGLQYIKDLGATHIHLLPVFDFASVDENFPSFNWGYDPQNYNVPEGSYSLSPKDGFSRVRELKSLVMSAHELGLGIIADVVYNHTYKTKESAFYALCPEYYYRKDEKGGFSNGSGCGNEYASEKPAARKFIIDSLCYLLSEYKLDGFRFDLMGLLDIETLNIAAKRLKAVNPDVILYGEGWTGGASALAEELRAVKKNAERTPLFAMFSDDFRDSVKGSVFDDKAGGFINGRAEECMAGVMSGLCGGVFHPDVEINKNFLWTNDPLQSVNYIESHDNLTLFDKLRLSLSEASSERIICADKMGAALIFFAQGVPFIQAGQELLRTKNFIHDSYNSPDEINCIKWDDVTKNREIYEYYKGLIAIRKKFSCFRLRTAEEIRKKIRFKALSGGAFIEYLEDLLIVVNPLENDLKTGLCGEFDVFADGEKASSEPISKIKGSVVAKGFCVMLLKENKEG